MASEDWATVDFGAAGGEEAVVLGEDKNLVAAGANMTVTITEADTYSFVLDAIDPAAPVLNVGRKIPFGSNTLLLRGDMNGWDESTPLTYEGGGIYRVTFPLTAATYPFKVATADWATVNLGGIDADSTDVVVGVPRTVVHGANPPNLTVTIDTDQDYDFVIDGRYVAMPTLYVLPSDDFDSDGIPPGERIEPVFKQLAIEQSGAGAANRRYQPGFDLAFPGGPGEDQDGLVHLRHGGFARSIQGASAATALAGGAPVTMLADLDRASLEILAEQIIQVQALLPVAQRHVQHLIEVAVVEIAPPVDAQQLPAHDGLQVVVLMGLPQQLQIAVEFAL